MAVHSIAKLFQTKLLQRGSCPPTSIPPGSWKAVTTWRHPWRFQQPLLRAEACTAKHPPQRQGGHATLLPLLLQASATAEVACHLWGNDHPLHFIFMPWTPIFTLIREQLPLISLLNPEPGMATSWASWMLSLSHQWDTNASYYPMATMGGISCGCFLLPA